MLFVHPVTATRTLNEQKLSTRHHFSMAKNSSMCLYTSWMRLQIYEEVGLCRCCIFSQCVSCSSVSIIRPTTLAATAKTRPYIRAHVCAFLLWVLLLLYLSAVRYSSSVLLGVVLFVILPVFISVFHAFFVRLLDSCQYNNEVSAFCCRWCWALYKYRRGVIALTVVVLLAAAISGAHANEAL